MFFYSVKAQGYGLGLVKYDVNFIVYSNYNIDKNERSREAVLLKIRNRLRKDFSGGFRVLSIKKKGN